MIAFDDTRLSYTDKDTPALSIIGNSTTKDSKRLKFETPEQAQVFSNPTIRRITVRMKAAAAGGTSIQVFLLMWRKNGTATEPTTLQLSSAIARSKLTAGAVVVDTAFPKLPSDATQFLVRISIAGNMTAGSVDIDCPTFEAGYGTEDKAKSTAEGAELRTDLAYGSTVGSR